MQYYIVDAFADKAFEGNPACVCVMAEWLPNSLMQQIAMENNLSETAFAVKEGNDYNLRWFTPENEIDLCGHATLATGFVIMNLLSEKRNNVCFHTLSGELTVNKKENLYEIDLPTYALKSVKVIDLMEEVIGIRPVEAWIGRDLVCVLPTENDIYQVNIDLEKAMNLDGLLLHITAKGSQYDCISRSFAPKLGVNEDPVCGSGHCHIAPLWAKKYNVDKIVAKQASKRGGMLYCTCLENRTKLAGHANLYASGEIFI